jgi:hypothetical protein
MVRAMKIFMVLALSVGLMAGCSRDLAPVDAGTDLASPEASLTIPTGTSLVSATLMVYITREHGEDVTVHRITSAWDEHTVTYANFGAAFDPTVIASFTADAQGWKAIDVSGLVQAWLDGTYDDFGFMLQQGATAYTEYASSEHLNADRWPKLEICYSNGGGTECFTVQRGILGEVADTYIIETVPNFQAGFAAELYTGYVNDHWKQTLLSFSHMPPPVDYGDCEGKVTELTLRYDGAMVDAHIVVMAKKNVTVFDGVGHDRHGTLGPETYYYVNGVYNTNIHTSCSQLIGPGLVSGDFTVLEGYSRHGGLLPPL